MGKACCIGFKGVGAPYSAYNRVHTNLSLLCPSSLLKVGGQKDDTADERRYVGRSLRLTYPWTPAGIFARGQCVPLSMAVFKGGGVTGSNPLRNCD